MHSMAQHVEAMLALKRSGAVAFDYGNNIRKQALDAGARTPLRFLVLCPSTFDRCFAKARARSAGSRFPGDANDIQKD